MVTDITTTANDISSLINVFTITLIPAIGGMVLAITNFVNHHTNRKDIKDVATKVAAMEQKAMGYDKTVGAQATTIGTIASLDPAVQAYVAAHEAQMQAAEAKIAALSTKIIALEAFIPQSVSEALKKSSTGGG